MQYNARAKHIIDYALNMEKLFKVSKCKNAQELWETLEKAQESIKESNNNNKDIKTFFMADVDSKKTSQILLTLFKLNTMNVLMFLKNFMKKQINLFV